jgi:hypothetical protein
MSNLDKCGARVLATLAIATILIFFSGQAWAASPNPVLVELFTSEGCSDCPPADALLRTLDSAQPVPGAQLIVLEEHVDYWDGDGWRDPFSSHAFTLRQSEYVERLRVANGPYTPQMVVDGSEAFVGNNRPQAGRALAKAAQFPKVDIQISAARVENGKVLAHLEVPVVLSKAEVFIVVALDHAESQVQRGENGGRRLEHVSVAKQLTSAGKVKKGEGFSKDVAVPLDNPGQAYRLIAFLQEGDQGKVLGAAVIHLQ